MDDIILQENNKLSAESVTSENIDSKIDEKNIYRIDNMSHDEKKEKIEWCKSTFEKKLENKYEFKIQNGMTFIHGKKLN